MELKCIGGTLDQAWESRLPRDENYLGRRHVEAGRRLGQQQRLRGEWYVADTASHSAGTPVLKGQWLQRERFFTHVR